MRCPGRYIGQEEVQLQPIRNLGARRRWVFSDTPQPLYSREGPGTHLQENGWTWETVWTGTQNIAPTGIRSANLPSRNESLIRHVSHISFSLLGFICLSQHFLILCYVNPQVVHTPCFQMIKKLGFQKVSVGQLLNISHTIRTICIATCQYPALSYRVIYMNNNWLPSAFTETNRTYTAQLCT